MPFKRPTTTPTPDELFDEWLVELGEAELKIILYIIRRTLGFRKNADAISYNQFLHGITTRDGRVLDRGCGVRNRTNLARALAKLEERSLIRSWKRRADDGDADVTVYALHFEGDDELPVDDPRGSTAPVPPWSSSGTTPHRGTGAVLPQSSSSTTSGTMAALPVVPSRYPQQRELQHKQRTTGVGKPTAHKDQPTHLDAGSSMEDGGIVALLLAEGIAPSRAQEISRRYPAEEIQQQIVWLDGRRYADRAACLVAAIESGYGPPRPSPRGQERSARSPHTDDARGAERDPQRYSRGSYGVCPLCGCSPCDATCTAETGHTAGEEREAPRPGRTAPSSASLPAHWNAS